MSFLLVFRSCDLLKAWGYEDYPFEHDAVRSPAGKKIDKAGRRGK